MIIKILLWPRIEVVKVLLLEDCWTDVMNFQLFSDPDIIGWKLVKTNGFTVKLLGDKV